MRKLYRLFAGFMVALVVHTPVWATQDGQMPNPTDGWNHTWRDVLIDLWVIGIIFAILAVYLLVKYSTRDKDAVGTAPELNFRQALAWCLIPSALFLADDFLLAAKGWSLWNIQRTVPAGAMEIKLTASQWTFDYEYPNGVEVSSSDRDEDEDLFAETIHEGDLVVPVGKPIVFRMTSTDALHSFGLTDYRLKEDIMPGRVTYLWFVAREPRFSQVVCVEFCGTNHSQMFNRVVAVSKKEYDAWMEKKQQEAALRKSSFAALKTIRQEGNGS
jgi:cytochrome c oxidase subunit 2